MKHMNMKTWMLCMMAMILFAAPVIAENKVIIVVGSTEEEAQTALEAASTSTNPESASIVLKAVLEKAGIEPETFYVDLTTPTNPAVKVKNGLEAVKTIKAAQPDVVVCVYDDALKYVGIKLDNIPVIFTWVFAELKSLGLPKANITGITRRSFAPDSWTLTKSLFNIESVGVICRNSAMMKTRRDVMVKNRAVLSKTSGVQFTDMYLVDTLDEWKKIVLGWKEDIIHLGVTSSVIDGDGTVPSAELVQWTLKNAKVPLIAALEADVKDGALLSIVASEAYAAKMVFEVVMQILGGKDVSNIPTRPMATGKLVFNATTAQKLGVEIPYEILASADKIYE